MHQSLASTSGSAHMHRHAISWGVPSCIDLPICHPTHTRPRRDLATCNVSVASEPTVQHERLNQHIREGHYETKLVYQQARKEDTEQPPIASILPRPDLTQTADVVVVGAGPAGLFLAAELAKRGLRTIVVGQDMPFVNNYGVWMDEFRELGLEHTIERSWEDTLCYFNDGPKGEVRVGRGYGRISRRLLRQHLLELCVKAGVSFVADTVQAVNVAAGGDVTHVDTTDNGRLNSRLVTLAAGAAAGRFLKYEQGAPVVAAQTAYGIEAEVEGYDEAYHPDLMTFMDFRRHHTGLWDEAALKIKDEHSHPNAGGGLWGSAEEAPSFLYAMPLGGNRVFLEETCLVSRPALPFAVLKRRLDRRLKAMGIRVKEVHEEEWSYIPVGGPLPVKDQPITAFGAAANLIHPATGFSVSRSIREAPMVADEISAALREERSVATISSRVWQKLWPQDKRTQATFHVFGMELLASLNLTATVDFFYTFFALPPYFWRGFLASRLSPEQLVAFALVTFFYAPFDIKRRLMAHLFFDPAGGYLLRAYAATILDRTGNAPAPATSSSATAEEPRAAAATAAAAAAEPRSVAREPRATATASARVPGASGSQSSTG